MLLIYIAFYVRSGFQEEKNELLVLFCASVVKPEFQETDQKIWADYRYDIVSTLELLDSWVWNNTALDKGNKEMV